MHSIVKSQSTFQLQTILQVLEEHSKVSSQEKAYYYVNLPEGKLSSITYRELFYNSLITAHKISRVCKKESTAVLIYPSGFEFIYTFLGCLYAGVIAIPIALPRRNQKVGLFESILDKTKPSLLLTSEKIYHTTKRIIDNSGVSPITWLDTTIYPQSKENSLPSQMKLPEINEGDPAFLQFTSGSTSSPKGVMVSHKNIISNQQVIYQAFKHNKNTIGVSWLPFFHDMGLIGGVLQPLFGGFPVYLMSPESFLQSPMSWLKLISSVKATTSVAPNFAYDLCADAISDGEIENNLDLSSWNLAANGAEPVRYKTMEKFSKKFVNVGFNKSAFYPCYGMAETTLLITGPRQQPFTHITVDKSVYSKGKLLKDKNSSFPLVSCGSTWNSHKVVIVHPDTGEKMPEGNIGEIWCQGDSIAKGYYKSEQETKETFDCYIKGQERSGPFLRTGDLGALLDGELYVTGRRKDLLIFRGANYYSHDIESVVSSSHVSFTKISVAFTISDPELSEEKLIILQEIKRADLKKINSNEIFRRILEEVTFHFGIPVYDILLLKPGKILRTSSGKVKRRSNRENYLSGKPDFIASLLNESQQEITDNPDTACPTSIAPWLSWLTGAIAKQTPLSVRQIKPESSLESLGMDSISIYKLIQYIDDNLAIAIQVEHIYEFSSVYDFAVYLSNQYEEKGDKNNIRWRLPEINKQFSTGNKSLQNPKKVAEFLANEIDPFLRNWQKGIIVTIATIVFKRVFNAIQKKMSTEHILERLPSLTSLHFTSSSIPFAQSFFFCSYKNSYQPLTESFTFLLSSLSSLIHSLKINREDPLHKNVDTKKLFNSFLYPAASCYELCVIEDDKIENLYFSINLNGDLYELKFGESLVLNNIEKFIDHLSEIPPLFSGFNLGRHSLGKHGEIKEFLEQNGESGKMIEWIQNSVCHIILLPEITPEDVKGVCEKSIEFQSCGWALKGMQLFLFQGGSYSFCVNHLVADGFDLNLFHTRFAQILSNYQQDAGPASKKKPPREIISCHDMTKEKITAPYSFHDISLPHFYNQFLKPKDFPHLKCFLHLCTFVSTYKMWGKKHTIQEFISYNNSKGRVGVVSLNCKTVNDFVSELDGLKRTDQLYNLYCSFFDFYTDKIMDERLNHTAAYLLLPLLLSREHNSYFARKWEHNLWHQPYKGQLKNIDNLFINLEEGSFFSTPESYSPIFMEKEYQFNAFRAGTGSSFYFYLSQKKSVIHARLLKTLGDSANCLISTLESVLHDMTSILETFHHLKKSS